jgi:hypothetical protein
LKRKSCRITASIQLQVPGRFAAGRIGKAVRLRYVPNAVMGILRVDLSGQPLVAPAGKVSVKVDPESEDRPEAQ